MLGTGWETLGVPDEVPAWVPGRALGQQREGTMENEQMGERARRPAK